MIPGLGRSSGEGNVLGMYIEYSSILAQRILWAEEPGRLWSMGSQSQIQLSDKHFLVKSYLNNCPTNPYELVYMERIKERVEHQIIRKIKGTRGVLTNNSKNMQ